MSFPLILIDTSSVSEGKCPSLTVNLCSSSTVSVGQTDRKDMAQQLIMQSVMRHLYGFCEVMLPCVLMQR